MRYRLKVLLVVLFATIATSVAACTYAVAVSPTTARDVAEDDREVRNPHLGGPYFRVFDVDEIDSLEEVPALSALFKMAEECSGIDGDFGPVRVFAAKHIMVRTPAGDWWGIASKFGDTEVVGMWAWNTAWIYILTGRTAEETAKTIVHEYVHYLMREGHPIADTKVAACNAFMEEERR